MKVNKLVSIDAELAELLQRETNASGLINQLLHDYFDTHSANVEKKNPAITQRSERNQSKNAGFEEKTNGKSPEREENPGLLGQIRAFWRKVNTRHKGETA